MIVGWSGGGSLALFYQSQAERPTITQTPAGDPVGIAGAGLIPADAIIVQAAHISRATMLRDMIDPSVTDERDPDNRDRALDIYDTANPNQPPYSADFIADYRAAQLARMRRITAWVKETLATLKARNTAELERGFVTHRTLAEPRFLDPALDPNDRKPNWCYLGNPETANTGPVGLARFSTLRSWLSQWSIDDSNADGVTMRGADFGAAAGDREFGGRCGAAAAYGCDLQRGRQRRQDHARDQGRDALLCGAAGQARRGAGDHAAMAERARSA